MNIGKNIQDLRESFNMTQQEFAEKVGLSRSAVSRIEQKTSVNTDLLEKISKAFNIPIVYLICKEEDIKSIDIREFDEIKSIRDLHRNSIEMYKRLPDKTKSFSRAIGFEIYKEIIQCENRSIESFSINLKKDIKKFFDENNQSLSETYINFIDNYTIEWIRNNELKSKGL